MSDHMRRCSLYSDVLVVIGTLVSVHPYKDLELRWHKNMIKIIFLKPCAKDHVKKKTLQSLD